MPNRGRNTRFPVDADRLLRLMDEKEWSGYRLSLHLGCSGGYISNLTDESDGGYGRRAKEPIARKLCAALGCEYEYLFHEVTPRQKEVQQTLFHVPPADPNSAPPVDRCERAIWECHAVTGGIYRYMKLIYEESARQIEKLLIEQNRLLNELLVEWKGGNA